MLFGTYFCTDETLFCRAQNRLNHFHTQDILEASLHLKLLERKKKHIWIKKQGFACIFVLNEKVISKSDYWLDYMIIVTMLHGSEILYGLFPLNGATFVSQMHFWVEQQSWACGLVDILHQW